MNGKLDSQILTQCLYAAPRNNLLLWDSMEPNWVWNRYNNQWWTCNHL